MGAEAFADGNHRFIHKEIRGSRKGEGQDDIEYDPSRRALIAGCSELRHRQHADAVMKEIDA